MTHAAFIAPAYVVALGSVFALLVQSWLAMRQAEKRAETLRERRRGSAR